MNASPYVKIYLSRSNRRDEEHLSILLGQQGTEAQPGWLGVSGFMCP